MGAVEAAVVDVWVAPLEVPPAVQQRLSATLSPAEWERARRYRFERHARRFVVARGWLRWLLGACTATDPGRVAFRLGPLGKPELADRGAGVCFNLSHAADLALVGIGPRAVGVDVEHTASDRTWSGVIAAACAPEELAVVDALPPLRRPEAFLRLWTGKEAYLKARGTGLAVEPSTVRVGHLETGRGPVGVAGDASSGSWEVEEVRPGPGYVGAVAAQGGDWSTRLRSRAELAALLGMAVQE